jgi:hypothetical protein
MEKIDRLGWAVGRAFSTYGLRVGVRSNRAEVLERIGSHLPPGHRDAPAGPVDRLYSLLVPEATDSRRTRRYALAYGDSNVVGRSVDAEEALEGFGTDLQLYVAMMAKRRIFVHAGVVGHKGRAIVLPGRSFAGKSTLVKALVDAGATYYSDEYAVLDARGRVHPYPSPLALRHGDGAPKTKIGPEALGVRATRPLPIGLVAHLRYRKGSRAAPRRVSAGEALLLLLRNTVPARLRPDEAFRTLTRAVAPAVAVNGFRGEAHSMVESLLCFPHEEPDARSAKA